MKKITIFLFTLYFGSAFSQKTLAKYPEGQFPYKEGPIQMAADMQNYFLTTGAKPCDKNEMYFVTLKIDNTGKPSLVKKKSDENAIERNKCAFNLAVKSLGSLKNWQHAEEQGEKVTAYFDFPFLTEDFFENYKPDYDISKIYQPAELPGGVKELRKEIHKKLEGYLDSESYNPKGKFIISFIIDADGSISTVDIEPKVDNSEQFFEDIKFILKKIKVKWNPGKIKGQSIKSKFRIPFNFKSADLD